MSVVGETRNACTFAGEHIAREVLVEGDGMRDPDDRTQKSRSSAIPVPASYGSGAAAADTPVGSAVEYGGRIHPAHTTAHTSTMPASHHPAARTATTDTGRSTMKVVGSNMRACMKSPPTRTM